VTPAEQFELWRAELAVELEAAIGELATARSTLAAVETAHAQARTAWHELDKFAAAGMRNPAEGVPGPLHGRLLNARAALVEAEAARGAVGAVKGAEQSVKALQDSIEFADRCITAAKVTQLPRPAVVISRRKPPTIEYDTIQVPREVAS
jgi:hypothetical protein